MVDYQINLFTSEITFHDPRQLNLICSKHRQALQYIRYAMQDQHGVTVHSGMDAHLHHTEMAECVERALGSFVAVWSVVQSLEFIYAAQQVAGDKLAYYRLDQKPDDTWDVVRYSPKSLKAAVAMGYEVR